MTDTVQYTPDIAPQVDGPLVSRYYELRHFLGIELIDIDRMYMETPRTLQDAVELSAKADANENDARHDYEIIKAAASDRIRSIPVAGKEPSEARITALLPLERDVQQARRTLDKARYEAQICTGLYKSLETQSRLLAKASDMINSGFISPSAAYDRRRSEIRQARVAAENREHKEEGRPIGRPIY